MNPKGTGSPEGPLETGGSGRSGNAERHFRENIGPSHYSTILGYNRFKTIEELRDEIEVGFEPAIMNDAIKNGIEKESSVIDLYEKIKGVKVLKAHWVRKGRILGKGDGLIGKDGGIEIKCHYGQSRPLSQVPIYYLVQILGYLHLYKREWWDLVSCCFDANGICGEYRIHRIYWKKFEKPWSEFWYPNVLDFIKEVRWTTG